MSKLKTTKKEKVVVSTKKTSPVSEAYTPLDFKKVEKAALAFAKHIEKNFDEITDVLLNYESFEVAEDEIGRTLDLLTHLKENEEYFKLRIGSVAAFLPRNQPLYALTCFTVIPSLMAKEVHFRIPQSMQEFLPELLETLKLKQFFPNIYPTLEGHQSFLRKHSALKVNPKTQESVPVTDAVIFTGTPARADQLRSVFDSRTLFITNGSGHNPVIISEDADVEKAVEAVLCLQLYNQGQDCAAPNAILVHKHIYTDFTNLLHKTLPTYKVGQYRDRENKIGPISDPFDLVRVQDFLIRHKEFVDSRTPGVIRAHHGIVEPTVISKPLKEGGNYVEMFSPLIFLQKYDSDEELAKYFEDADYVRNAMYVTVYGTSSYAKSLIGRTVNGKLLHDTSTLLFNTHLHAEGIERGTKPYGGYGYGASNLTIRGSGVSKPTLPQRDIYENVVLHILNQNKPELYRKEVAKYTQLEEKNIEKLLRLGNQTIVVKSEEREFASTYFDLKTLESNMADRRYIKLDPIATYQLLSKPNLPYITDMTPLSIKQVRKLRETLMNKSADLEEFKTELYNIVGEHPTQEARQTEQKKFFGHVYHLLFGKSIGPRLTTFLWEIDSRDVDHLLDV
jgi:lysyl-tRNA synthetase class 1